MGGEWHRGLLCSNVGWQRKRCQRDHRLLIGKSTGSDHRSGTRRADGHEGGWDNFPLAWVDASEGGIHFHASPSMLLLGTASAPASPSSPQHPPTRPLWGLLGLGCIYCQWLWFISRCLWPGTGCLQIAPQRVGKCRHLPFCEALSRNEKDSHKMLHGVGGGWVTRVIKSVMD